MLIFHTYVSLPEGNTCAMLKRWYIWCHSSQNGIFTIGIRPCLLTDEHPTICYTFDNEHDHGIYVVNPRIDSMENLSEQFVLENERLGLVQCRVLPQRSLPTSFIIYRCV